MSGRALAAVALSLSLPVASQGIARADDVMVQVTMLKAKPRGGSDRDVRRHRTWLRRLAGYRAYRVLDDERRGCRWERRQRFVLPGGQQLHLTPIGVRDERVLMKVRLMDGGRELVDTDVRIEHDGTMVLGMERDGQVRDGALLIMLKAGVAQ